MGASSQSHLVVHLRHRLEKEDGTRQKKKEKNDHLKYVLRENNF